MTTSTLGEPLASVVTAAVNHVRRLQMLGWTREEALSAVRQSADYDLTPAEIAYVQAILETD